MAISEFEKTRIEHQAKQFCEKKNKSVPDSPLSYSFRLENQSLYILQISPRWDDPEQMMELEIAKLSYVKTTGLWQLYNHGRNLKWQRFIFDSSNKDLKSLLDIVDENPIGCFGM